MRVLLFGEYSRFHNTLKEGLVRMGHDVLLAGNNDFKNYPLDVSYYAKFSKDLYVVNKVRQLIFRIFSIDIAQWESALRFYINRKKCRGFDVVQLINVYPIGTTPYLEQKILKYIFRNNTKAYLSACGDDFVSVKYMLDNRFRYSTMTPCIKQPEAGHCKYSRLYVTAPFIKLHNFVYSQVSAVIPGDLDYAIPWSGDPKSVGLIPYPINTDRFHIQDNYDEPISIFHGINRANYYKKGNGFFEKALEIIKQQYGDHINIIQVESIPYDEYIKLYDSCSIVLDQVYSYDQGYNALEAMARGKVVFTGAEDEFNSHFALSEKVAINALPDVESIVSELQYLIENPTEIKEIGLRARKFVEDHHDYRKVAEQFIKVWQDG
jgi:glycosyltransferase involved in cell wall biosynthesis